MLAEFPSAVDIFGSKTSIVEAVIVIGASTTQMVGLFIESPAIRKIVG